MSFPVAAQPATAIASKTPKTAYRNRLTSSQNLPRLVPQLHARRKTFCAKAGRQRSINNKSGVEDQITACAGRLYCKLCIGPSGERERRSGGRLSNFTMTTGFV